MFFLYTFLLSVVYASFFEWTLHRYVMHRIYFGFRYAFEAHTLMHHGKLKADSTYHLRDGIDKKIIRMAWWNAPVLVAIATLLIIPLCIWLNRWSIAAVVPIVFTMYYGAYEHLHWCMHLPKNRRIEKPWIFRLLNGHHLLHHRYMGSKNFNVVFPLADLLLGTLMLRSRTHFAQARGPSVPDVQPKTKKIV